MNRSPLFIAIAVFLVSCHTARPVTYQPGEGYNTSDTLITHSLFNDMASTISEENIQKILDGKYQLPADLRVAIVRIDAPITRKFFAAYASDEAYLKTQQSYLDLFSTQLKRSPRVTKLSTIPRLLISSSPSFTSTREAAVRIQADVVIAYSISSDIYSRYKLFSKPDIKAFATTQLIVLDVRTGLIPFSAIVTKDVLSQKKKEELDHAEASHRVQHEAVLLTINDITAQLITFLKKG